MNTNYIKKCPKCGVCCMGERCKRCGYVFDLKEYTNLDCGCYYKNESKEKEEEKEKKKERKKRKEKKRKREKEKDRLC